MKILMFGMSSYPGGIENYIVNYFCNKKFPYQKIHIDFVIYEQEVAYEEVLKKCGYRVYKVPYLKRKPLGYYKAVSDLLRKKRYDCVYVNMLTAANVFPIQIAARNNVRKIILHAHANSTIHGFVRKTLHNLNKHYCNKIATHRLACSQEAGEWLYGKQKFTVIPNAIDCEKFGYSKNYRNEIREKYAIPEDTLVIGHVGRITEEKNHLFMLDIMNEVLKEQQNSQMVFVGDGVLRQAVQEKAEKLGIKNQVIFAGTSTESYKFYSAFDCFLFPSSFEGFGMAALEAQACGLICYCSDCLPTELNVTGSLKYLALGVTSKKWAKEILAGEMVDRMMLHQRILMSDYNIDKQIKRLVQLLVKGSSERKE